MPCFHPLQAWRTTSGDVVLSKTPIDGQYLRLPCGNCLGCRTNRAQSWALRCQLELRDHAEHGAVFGTFTYDDQHKPLTLNKTHVSTYLKKIRKTFSQKLRFFASGEYGEQTHRPHYHAIIYGVSEREAPRLEKAWEKGHVRIDKATAENIAYTAGYCSKKIGYKRFSHERSDPTTGEVYQWQPPFILMSRRPGIGATAKQYLNSWRLYAVKDGHKMPVPRYYKDYFKNQATPEELDKLAQDIYNLNLTAPTLDTLRAQEKIAESLQQIRGATRHI